MFGTFKAKRNKTLKSKIKVNGEVLEHYMDLEDIMSKYSQYNAEFVKADTRLNELKGKDPSSVKDYYKRLDEAQKEYGRSILYLYHIVFGEDNTDKLLTFYKNSAKEMLLMTVPYLTGTIARKTSKFLKRSRKLARKK